jgi:hypothetical protein
MRAAKKQKHKCVCEAAIAKYGEPLLEVIETIEDEKPTNLVKKLNEAERKWIAHYDSTNFSKGYNVKEGGERKTPLDMIYEEIFEDVFEKEGWNDFFAGVDVTLYKIRTKLCEGNEELTEDERSLWNDYKFNRYDFLGGLIPMMPMGETSFREIYEEIKENAREINREYPSYEEDGWWKEPEDGECFDYAMKTARHHLLTDIQERVWNEVYDNSERYLREWWQKDNNL